MKIGVLGAGVIGVSTAYALARQGHRVTVIDKGETVASGASHANGAQLSYSYVDPLAGPETLRKLPSYLMGADPAVKMGFSLRPAYLQWGLNFIRNCSAARATENLRKRREIAIRSKQALDLFESELPDGVLKRSGQGKIILAHTSNELTAFRKSSETKKNLGIETKILDKPACIELEPALEGWSSEFAGGLYSEEDATLDPLIYCRALETTSETKFGVQFSLGETIEDVNVNGNSSIHIQTDKHRYEFECIIVCLGTDTNATLKPLGISVPSYPFQGYSVTLPARAPKLRTSITDPKHKIVFANIGDQVRIAGFMDANQHRSKTKSRGKQLISLAKQLWPTLTDYESEPHLWTQFRPMTPSGVPIVGPSDIAGIYLNVGHGSLGYTFAPGCAMQIAEHIGYDRKNH